MYSNRFPADRFVGLVLTRTSRRLLLSCRSAGRQPVIGTRFQRDSRFGLVVGSSHSVFRLSRLTGNSLFSERYLSLSLPGTGLAATCAAGWVMRRPDYWRPAALALALALLLFRTTWRTPWTEHFISHWRAASEDVNHLVLGPETPVVCPSSVIEGHPPIWHRDYSLPGFLYPHLEFYPIGGKPFLFPTRAFPETQGYASNVMKQLLSCPAFPDLQPQ